MFRRLALVLAVLALVLAPPAAWAASARPLDSDRHERSSDRGDDHEDRKKPRDDHDEEERDRRGGEREEPEHGDEHREEHEEREDHDDDYYEDYAYYGTVRATSPLVVGSRTLVGDLALLEFLAPGMQLEVEGRVVGGRIRVKEVHVLYPNPWAYYEGPLEGRGWVRAWFDGGRVWRERAADPGPRVRLVACYREDWLGLPAELRPSARPPGPGLWLLEGLLFQGQVRWTRITRLAECED